MKIVCNLIPILYKYSLDTIIYTFIKIIIYFVIIIIYNV